MLKRLMIVVIALFVISGFVVEMAIASPILEIVPSKGEAGSVIKINGKGFKPKEEVDVLFVLDEYIKIGLGTEKVDVIVADEQGNFSVSSGIPINAKPGTYTIEAIGNMDSSTSTKVEVTPKTK